MFPHFEADIHDENDFSFIFGKRSRFPVESLDGEVVK